MEVVHVIDPRRSAPGDHDIVVIDPEHVGQLPREVFAIQQTGHFDGQPGKKTVIELTHQRSRVDRATQYVVAYGSPDFTYRAFYGRIVWETEGDIVPEAAPVQTLFDPGVRVVKGVKMVGDLPAKGRPGKVKESKRKTVTLGDETD